MKFDSSITLKNRYSCRLDHFTGVDFSSDPTLTSPSRSPDMENFINEYGIPHKRPGWLQIAKLDGKRINGIFSFPVSGGELYIVHAGTGFFVMDSLSVSCRLNEVIYGDNFIPSLITDSKSEACFFGERLYIIGCGDYLVYGTWNSGASYELRRVYGDTDTYIPTTTSAISDDSLSGSGVSFSEYVNVLSRLVKNTLCGSSESNKTWTVDSGMISLESEISITMQVVESENNYTTINEYLIMSGLSDENTLYKVEKNGISITDRLSSAGICGSVDREKGKITFTFPTSPPSPSPNIEVIFDPGYKDISSRVTCAGFGTLFGVGGASDRLFLTGNENYPNIDFYSSASDFTYFPDVNSTALGTDERKITGYLRLRDGSLATFKESSSRENTVYYRTGSYLYDENGNITGSVFPISASSPGEGAVNNKVGGDLSGDSIFLSENGVFGLMSSSNTLFGERYARPRSLLINEKLTREAALREAVSAVYKGKYYLCLDNVCYIADSAYKFTPDGAGTYNYEWWYWTGIPARVICVIGELLVFGSSDGKICIFSEEHCDKELFPIKTGDITPSFYESKFVLNKELTTPEENNVILFSGGSVYARVASIYINGEIHDENGDMVCESDEDGNAIFHFCDEPGDAASIDGTPLNCIYDGENVLVGINSLTFPGLDYETTYIISDIDRGARTCKLRYYNDNSYVRNIPNQSLPSRTCQLVVSVCRRPLYITGVDGQTFMIKENAGGAALDFNTYYQPQTSLTGIIIKKHPVTAKRSTPLFDLGHTDKSKTLLKMILSSSETANGKIIFGYETRENNNLSSERRKNSVFSTNDLSFNNFTFETGFQTSVSIRTNERNFNYIRFRFYSDDENDCTLNSFTFIYKINKNNYGIN